MRWGPVFFSLVGVFSLIFAAKSQGETSANTKSETTSKFRAGATSSETVIVFIGDSLTQGYGVRAEEAYPELVGQKLRERGFHVKIINGGISGSVTAEADRRLRWYLKAKPQIVVLALGANDGMKGTPPMVIEKNLRQAIELAQNSGMTVVLSGIRMFSNLGPAYVQSFESVFPRLAREKKIPLIPFLLEDVALQKEFNQSDMRHPNAEGHKIIAARVAKKLEEILIQRERETEK